MMLDELMKEIADVLQHMQEENDYRYIQRLARERWYWNITPPAKYYSKVNEYIKRHPEEFKGAGPR